MKSAIPCAGSIVDDRAANLEPYRQADMPDLMASVPKMPERRHDESMSDRERSQLEKYNHIKDVGLPEVKCT